MTTRRRHSRLAAIASIRARPVVVEHTLALDRWDGADLDLLLLSDFHVAAPYSSLQRLRQTVRAANALSPDLIVLGGDFLADRALVGRYASAEEIMAELSKLSARLGVFAVLGNHDWADCALARQTRMARNSVVEAIGDSPVHLLRNDARGLFHGGQDFWLVGFDSQRPMPRDWSRGLHDPNQAFATVPADQFVILAAHEPDYFAHMDGRVDVQLSGHTHGGQFNLFGWRPVVPSQFGDRFAHGHIRDHDRHLVVSGGLGFSGLPLRIGAPPEITLIRITSARR